MTARPGWVEDLDAGQVRVTVQTADGGRLAFRLPETSTVLDASTLRDLIDDARKGILSSRDSPGPVAAPQSRNA